MTKPMKASGTSDKAKSRGVLLIAISACVSAIGFPFAAAAYAPTAVGYVALPGVVIFTFMAVCSVVCFLLCPMRPWLPKLIALVLAVNALFWFIHVTGYYWLHLVYHA